MGNSEDELFFDGIRYLSAADAAASSGLHRDYVARLAREGKIRAKRIGKSWYVNKASFEEFLVRQEYEHAKRRKELMHDRRREYIRASRIAHGKEATLSFSKDVLTSLSSTTTETKEKAKSLVRTGTYNVQRALAIAASRAQAHAGVPVSHFAAFHVPHPVTEFAHKAVALITAFVLIFGAYSLVDARYARFALETMRHSTERIMQTGTYALKGGAVEWARDAASQLAAAATNSGATLDALYGSFTPDADTSFSLFARTWTEALNSLVSDVVLPKLTPFAWNDRARVFVSVGSGSGAATPVTPDSVPVKPVPPKAPTPSGPVTQTVINQPILERVVESVRTVVSGGVSEALLDARLAALNQDITNRMSSLSVAGVYNTNNVYNTVSSALRIEELTDLILHTPAIDGGSITGATITGGSVTATDFSGVLSVAKGGTGTSTYTAGDLLYADAVNSLGRLGIGSNGQVLKISSGTLAWGTDNSGGGGGSGAWSTTTDDLAIYPTDPNDVVIIGASATTTTGNILEVNGSSLLRNSVVTYGLLTAPRFTATSSVASVFPYASSTALSVSGTGYFGTASTTNLTISSLASGSLLKTTTGGSVIAAVAGTDYVAGVTGDWTGTFDGLEGATYLASSFSTTSADYWRGLTNFFSTTSAIFFADASTTIPKTYASNTFTGAQSFIGGLTSSALTLTGLNGPLDARSGVVGATTSIGVLYGGTGLTSAPSYGNILVGNSSSGYTLTATSSLGLLGSNQMNWQVAFGALTPTTTLGILVTASTTIGNGSQTGGLTISGGATTTGNSVLQGTLALTGAATLSSTLDVTGKTTLGNASTTNLTATYASSTSAFFGNLSIATLTGVLRAAAGVVSTGLVNLASEVSGILQVANGGTGWAAIEAGTIPYGNGSSALATTTAGTGGQVLALLNGVPTWTATTTLSTITGTLTVDKGGTGATTLAGGQVLFGNGTGPIGTVATGTVSAGTGIALDNATRSVLGGALQISFSAPASSALSIPYASTTMLTATTASTTGLYISGISGSLLKTNANGQVAAATAGTDYLTSGTIFSYPFINLNSFATGTAATTTSILTQGVFFASSTIAASQFPYASTTAITATTASSTNLIISSTGGTGTRCLQVGADGTVSANASACGTGSGADPFLHQSTFGEVASATTTPFWFQSGANLYASSTVRFGNAGISPFFFNSAVGNLGLGTTSPFATLQIATSTGKNLVLSDSGAGANLKHWLFSSQGGNLYIGTTTDVFGTSTPAAVSISNAGVLTLASALGETSGGTGENTYVSGDVLYADAVNSLARLPKSTDGLVLKLVSGLPAWSADNTSGGSEGLFATTTDSLALHPSVTSRVLLLGTNATSTTGNILEVLGSSLFRNSVVAYGTITGPRFVATTTVASDLPYASTTAVTATTASTTSLYISGISGSLLKTNADGQVAAAVAGTDYLTSSTIFGFPFTPTLFGSTQANATSTLIGFTQGIYALASSTIGNGTQAGGLYIAGGATTTGTLTLTSLTNALLKTNALGQVVAAVLGTDYQTFGYLFPNNATTTLLAFNGGLTTTNATATNLFAANILASVAHFGATATSTFTANGSLGVASSTPWGRLAVNPAGGDSNQFVVGSSTQTSFVINPSGYVGIGTTSPYGLLSLFAASTSNALSLFNISSTTSNFATTTLFSIGNTGSTTASNGFNISDGCFAIDSTCLSLATITGTLGVAGGGTGATSLSGGQVLFGNGTGAVGTVATGTVSAGTAIALDSSSRSVLGGNLQISFSAPSNSALSIPYASTTMVSATTASS
ncbi:MAG: helix-turn-helix domain-containing protein, partial [Patescibacteria group bacterium]